MVKVDGWSTNLPDLVVVTRRKLHLGREKDPPDARWVSLASWVIRCSLVMLTVGVLAVTLEPEEIERSSANPAPLLCLTSLVTGFLIIQALIGDFSRALFVISCGAVQF